MSEQTAKAKREQKHFFKFLTKLHERLTIVLDDNVSKRVDPTEQDIKMLEILYNIYYDPRVNVTSWMTDGEESDEIVTEQSLF